ncbi:hypothetical protein GIB67_018181 [Kingdonia uniflora]|uniref:Retrovirus-related Pol polyprotein from transposon TNT 1-94-like beta-barrel domain-containing protein n=1 Tax=Kingdonia uniflora TaxID=39325 RepID=A0A7J7NM86_9MAGN|nr:hypothetical protein GIB67_018181 [Kingdonia uniflora]
MVVSGKRSFNRFIKGTYWSYGQLGHYRSDCKVGKGNEENSARGFESDTNKLAMVTGNDSDEAFLVVAADGSCHDRGWVFDSGATMHVWAHKAWFSNYAMCEGSKFVLASDGPRRPISGVGAIRVRMFDGRIWKNGDEKYDEDVKDGEDKAKSVEEEQPQTSADQTTAVSVVEQTMKVVKIEDEASQTEKSKKEVEQSKEEMVEGNDDGDGNL